MAFLTYRSFNDYCRGYIDGRIQGNICPDFDVHYSNCFDDRVKANPHNIHIINMPYPQRAIMQGTVGTNYATFYRIHSKKYFKYGKEFAENWKNDERKRKSNERFSPPGIVGHYLGLTFDAALDEAYYYTGSIDPNEKILLVIECYFKNILYLAHPGVLTAVWKAMKLPPMGIYDMFIAIMNPATNNKYTNKIGIWARKQGLDGIIFPSARYGQRIDVEELRRQGKHPYPVLDVVPIGCVCDDEMGMTSAFFGMALGDHLHEKNTIGEWVPLYAELNLVLFSGRQLRGQDRAVFYQTCPIEMADQLVAADPRLQSKHYTYYVKDS